MDYIANPDGYCQRDPRWGSVPLGTDSRYTLSSAGCLVTAAAEMIKRMYFGSMDPGKLNRWLCRNNGFVDGHMFNFSALEGLPNLPITLDEIINCTKVPAPIGRISDIILRATEVGPYLHTGVILEVRFNPYVKESYHWVLAITTSENFFDNERDFLVMDPWTGYACRLLSGPYGRYDWDLARMIYRVAIYKVGLL